VKQSSTNETLAHSTPAEDKTTTHACLQDRGVSAEEAGDIPSDAHAAVLSVLSELDPVMGRGFPRTLLKHQVNFCSCCKCTATLSQAPAGLVNSHRVATLAHCLPLSPLLSSSPPSMSSVFLWGSF
jgi:hypothetical protein